MTHATRIMIYIERERCCCSCTHTGVPISKAPCLGRMQFDHQKLLGTKTIRRFLRRDLCLGASCSSHGPPFMAFHKAGHPKEAVLAAVSPWPFQNFALRPAWFVEESSVLSDDVKGSRLQDFTRDNSTACSEQQAVIDMFSHMRCLAWKAIILSDTFTASPRNRTFLFKPPEWFPGQHKAFQQFSGGFLNKLTQCKIVVGQSSYCTIVKTQKPLKRLPGSSKKWYPSGLAALTHDHLFANTSHAS